MNNFNPTSPKAILAVLAVILGIFLAGCQKNSDLEGASSFLVENHFSGLQIPSQEDIRTLSFSIPEDWHAHLEPTSATSWITLDKNSGGGGENRLSLMIASNKTDSVRNACLNIISSGVLYEVQISQAGGVVSLEESFYFVVSENRTTFKLPLNPSKYEVIVSDEDTEWLTAFISDSTLVMVVEESDVDRQSSFILRDLLTFEERAVVINQLMSGVMSEDSMLTAKASSILTASAKVNYFTWEGGTKTVDVFYDGTWELNTGSVASWCSVKRSGDRLAITVDQRSNTLKADRVTSIPLKYGDQSYSLTVVQKGNVTASSEEPSSVIQQSTVLSASVKVNYFTWEGGDKVVNVICDGTWELNTASVASWCTVKRSGNQLEISVLKRDNTLKADRVTSVLLVSGDLSYSLTIVQKGNTSTVSTGKTEETTGESTETEPPVVEESVYFAEKEVLQLVKSSVGKGINVVILGDGFLTKDLIRGGRYEKIMRETAEHFFSIYPYSSYREYFNVYMVAASSQEEGVSGEFKQTVNNCFGSYYGSGTSVGCTASKVQEYVKVIPGYTSLNYLTAIVVLNSTKYAGTCIMSKSGFSISLCPMPEDNDYRYTFRAIVTHEAGGHGFPKLMDEYYTKGTISSSEIATLKSWQKLDLAVNIDFTSDPTEVIWRDFFDYPQYSKEVGVYQGAYTYTHGVWRSSESSCMSDNSPYYNVVSRWAIVKKIHSMAGISYSFLQFLKDDQIPIKTRLSDFSDKFESLGAPIMLD